MVYTILKLIILYPVLTYLSDNELFVIQMDKDPDIFRCFNENITQTLFNVSCKNYALATVPIPRPCCENEEQNQTLFYVIIPSIVASLFVSSIPAGFALSYFMQIKKLNRLEEKINRIISPIVECAGRLIEKINCCQNNKNDLNETTTHMEEIAKDDIATGDKPSTAGYMQKHDQNTENVTDGAGQETSKERGAIDAETGLENPVVIFKNVRKIFTFKPPRKYFI